LYHTYVIPERDQSQLPDCGARSYFFAKDAKQMVEHLAHALKQTSRETTILLYAPALDPHLKKMTELADRVFCIYEGEKTRRKGGQRCLEHRPHWRHTHEMAKDKGGQAD
jgi:hypothetical protein